MDLKTALKNFRKDRYVSSMMGEELETIIASLEALQAQKAMAQPVEKVEAKLLEALALLKGDGAQAPSKSAPRPATKAEAPARDGRRTRPAAAVEAPPKP